MEKTINDFDVIQKVLNNYALARNTYTDVNDISKYEYHLVEINPSTYEMSIITRLGSSNKNSKTVPVQFVNFAKSEAIDRI